MAESEKKYCGWVFISKEDAPDIYDGLMAKVREFTLNVDVQVENLPADIRDELDIIPGVSFMLNEN